MSRSASTSSSRKLSALTEYYDADTESLTRTGSRVESLSIDFSRNSSLASPTSTAALNKEPLITRESRLPLFESETETETSTSYTSAANYTDSEFRRVNRQEEGFGESAEGKVKSDEGCFKSEAVISDSGNDTVDGLSTLLFYSSLTSAEAQGAMRFGCETDSKSSSSRCMISELSPNDTESESIKSSEKCSDKQRETEREIIEKKRALRNSFREIVKEARKTLRQTREKRRMHEINPRHIKTANKQQKQKGKINNTWVNPKKDDAILKETKVKGAVERKRTRVSSKGSNLLMQRGLELEKIQVRHLITELSYWNLHEQAANVKRALTFTEEKEKELDIQLEEERQIIKSRKSAERWNQRQEEKRKRLEEIRKMEAERKEKEAKERQRRIEEAKIQREHNRMLWESYNKAVLANSFTRSFTFSYFPRLRLRPIERKQIDPHKITHSAKVRQAREKYGGSWY